MCTTTTVRSMGLAEFCHNRIVQLPHESYFNVRMQHKERGCLVKMQIIQMQQSKWGVKRLDRISGLFQIIKLSISRHCSFY